MWEGKTSLGNEVWVHSGLCHALLWQRQRFGLWQTAAPHLKSATADIFLPCFGARFLLKLHSALWEMHHHLVGSSIFTISLEQPQWVQMPAVDCAARRKVL